MNDELLLRNWAQEPLAVLYTSQRDGAASV